MPMMYMHNTFCICFIFIPLFIGLKLTSPRVNVLVLKYFISVLSLAYYTPLDDS